MANYNVAANGNVAILDLVPKTLHERVPLFVGSTHEMAKLTVFIERPLKV
ncbi:MAG TPA: hypothetical protein VGM76_07760 [Lacipirellulaceae bacterium]|jgi:fructose-1,6-bisphosphatase